MKRSLLLVAVCAYLISLSFNANTADIEDTDHGWYNEQGVHDIENLITAIGVCCVSDELVEARSYFLFEIPSLGEAVTTATLQLEATGYWSDDDFESATLWDVSSSHLPLLSTENGSGSGTNIFTDLGTGTTYGSLTVEIPIPGTSPGTFPPGTNILNISLNSAAIADINASIGGLFAIGISLDEISPPEFSNESLLFNQWLTRAHLLVTSEVPLPEFPLEIFMPPILQGGNTQPSAP